MSTDAIVMLRDDHKRMRKLIRACRNADGSGSASRGGSGGATEAGLSEATGGGGELVDELLHELTVHTFVEDEVMYPRVRTLVPETERLVLEFHEEHHVVDVLARELEAMDAGDPSYAAKAHVLMDALERHIDAEEREWFPRVREAVGRKQLQAIGARMADVREQAPDRPHRPLLRQLADALSG
ncbi:hemerythrin domain-containing protein [Streptomyces sp. WAC06614]|uniref:hemerythrin domain-containing protein n=1 Tax=Streptomyces sp. WAC06614 TaxID=2487416 RepID=UPI000F7A5560|nr:hemerythrin domain-containing protein [Streptomyces sp. WAC06614]RSS70324.1 hemerythrin domain-containing protein [Streptomyces sp. WAC06614]